jgi:1-phosphatidylinositol-3-phosphate 5-kinase
MTARRRCGLVSISSVIPLEGTQIRQRGLMAALRHDVGKPLPTPPMDKTVRKALTIESISHLHQFIGHVIEEETDYSDAEKDAWLRGIEVALHDLAKEVDAGVWLAGIRCAKVAKRKREEKAAAEARKREQERLAKEKETEARSKAKQRAPAVADSAKQTKEVGPAATEAKIEVPRTRATGKPPDDNANRNLRALQQLRNLATRRRASSSDGSKRARHLLLTVALPDASSLPPPSHPLTASDATAQRCTFSPGVYSLPPPDLFGEDPDDNNEAVVNSALYGFKEWEGASEIPPLSCAPD